ncbi:hypothetical protein DLREEDagrD3_02460 [Denitratisoma sp. agr-D3]
MRQAHEQARGFVFQNHLVEPVGDPDPDYLGEAQQPHDEGGKNAKGATLPAFTGREKNADSLPVRPLSGTACAVPARRWAGSGILAA